MTSGHQVPIGKVSLQPECLSAPLSDLQEDVCAEAEGAAEAVRQAAEETEGAEGWREVHQAGGKDTAGGLSASHYIPERI